MLAIVGNSKLIQRHALWFGIAIFAIYFFTAVLELKIIGMNTFASLLWPPTAIAFVSLAAFGLRFWPAIFFAAFTANAITGASLPAALGIATGNTLEAFMAAWWCCADGNFHFSLDRFTDVSRLILRAAFASTLISACMGVFTLWSLGALPSDKVTEIWLKWWVGDLLSNMTIAPLLMIFISGFSVRGWFGNSRRTLEALVYFAIASVLTLSILNGFFFGWLLTSSGIRGIYLLIPILLCAAIRFGQRGAVLALFGISMTSLINTSLGVGPFVHGSVSANIFHLLFFILTVAVTGLMIGAVVTERENERLATEAASLAKTEFLANMSHEIRTPLGAVMGFSELLMDTSVSMEERQMYMETIRRNGGLLLNIIDDVLDLSRVELGKIQFEKTAVSIPQLISDLNILMRPRAVGKGIDFLTFVDAPVPEFIHSDSQRLRQILLNLIGNAIKFTESGQVELSVKKILLAENQGVEFIVKDSGVGIDPAHAQKIFNPFTQADASTTRRFGGTGLGLSLSRKIAQAMGGDIALTKSALGYGSEFTLTLDLGRAPEAVSDHEVLEERGLESKLSAL